MLSGKLYPYSLVFVQVSCLVYLLVSGPLIASGYAGILIESLGVFLGIYAIFVMRPGNFNISSLPKETGKLVTNGPYAFIRHPMYTAQLLVVLPLLIDAFTWWRLLAFTLLVITLLLKIRYEEKALKLKFSLYQSYTGRTKKLIPFIY